VQRVSIEEDINKVQIWKAAIKTVAYSRALMHCLEDPVLWEIRRPRRSTAGSYAINTPGPASDSSLVDADGVVKSTELAPASTPRPRSGRASFSMNGVNVLEVHPNVLLNHLLLQQNTDEYANHLYSRLPAKFWTRVIRLAADPQGVLDLEQEERAMKFGSDRQSLQTMSELLPKGTSHQIWHLLDATGCLSYLIQDSAQSA